MTANDITIASEKWSVRIAPEHGGRITQISVDGRDMLVDTSHRTSENELLWGCYPMVPWAGRLRNGTFTHDSRKFEMDRNEAPHALHGFGFRRQWNVNHHSSTAITMSLDLSDVSPFDGWCEHSVYLEDNIVRATLTIASNGGTFPAMVGWHPWFSREWLYDVSFASMLQRDSENIVTTTSVSPSVEPWDDCFHSPRFSPRLVRPNSLSSTGELGVTVESDCSHWMLYTEPAHAFCLEPMSGPPNSLDSSHPAHVLVSPDQPLQRSFVLRTSTVL